MAALTRADEDAIADWHYEGRHAVYDPGRGAVRADAGYVGLRNEVAGLAGYACFGAEARVPGLPPDPDVVDVGFGLRPDLVGGGWGRQVVLTAIDAARSRLPEAHRARAVVLDWNTRSRHALEAAGFVAVGTHTTPDGRTFVVHEHTWSSE